MRYDNWDVLLFPSGHDARVPLKEFKVNCHVVQDNEFAHSAGSFGQPNMTCFVPSLEPESQFHISIHCWDNPTVSNYSVNCTKHPELILFEARILIDGRMVASTTFEPYGQWPHLIATTSELTKQGELESLKFPSFHRELLYQNHWNPADDVGRIKIVISEGLPRESINNPFERLKNVITFSFQHAPLDILETNGIAWPNPQMWRRPQNNPAITVPTYCPDEGAESHLHSPRRKSYVGQGTTNSVRHGPFPTMYKTGTGFTTLPPGLSKLPMNSVNSNAGYVDPFGEAAYQEWVNSLALQQHQHGIEPKAIWPTASNHHGVKHPVSDIDMSMADYVPSAIGQNISMGAMSMNTHGLEDESPMDNFNVKVPANTPTTISEHFDGDLPQTAVSGGLTQSLAHSLLNQPYPLSTLQNVQPQQVPMPAAEIRSRKENRHLNKASSTQSPSSNASPSLEAQIRKFSQISNAFGVIGNDRDSSGSSSGPAYSRHPSAGEFGSNLTNQPTSGQTYSAVAASSVVPGSGSEKGTKRSRNFTPASSKAIDDEDEPRRVTKVLQQKNED